MLYRLVSFQQAHSISALARAVGTTRGSDTAEHMQSLWSSSFAMLASVAAMMATAGLVVSSTAGTTTTAAESSSSYYHAGPPAAAAVSWVAPVPKAKPASSSSSSSTSSSATAAAADDDTAAATNTTISSSILVDGGGDRTNHDQVTTTSTTIKPFAMATGRRRTYDVSARAIQGGRVTMEDEYFVADGGRFAAVFDGHGGGGVSSFLKHHLYELLQGYLKEKQWELDYTYPPGASHASSSSSTTTTANSSSSSTNTKTPSLPCFVAAIRSAFERVERDVLANDALKYQGSTAVAVIVHESDEGHRTLLSANVGDSRAILSRRGRAVDLTRDHKPNEEREKARILSMGELIEWDRFAKVHRVRNLSLSRAIGDRYAKPIISSEVEIQHFPIAEGSDEFFLLASDGLWDVMTSQDVVSFVHGKIDQELSRDQLSKDDVAGYRLVLRRNMARFVANEAMRRGSGDNVCVLMVWLDDLNKSSSVK